MLCIRKMIEHVVLVTKLLHAYTYTHTCMHTRIRKHTHSTLEVNAI
jgi:hypothetical protein